MRATEIIRGILDLIDAEIQTTPESEVVMTQKTETEPQLVDLIKLAGLECPDTEVTDTDYVNQPDPQIRSVAAVLASGDDVNKSKHPADIRTNAGSMFPEFQAKGF